MKQYRVRITGDKYPTDYTVEATGWGPAVNRAIRAWKKKFKGSRTQELKIHAVLGGEVVK